MTTNPLAPTHRRGQQLQHTFQRPRRDKADPSVKVTLNQAGQYLVRGDRGGYCQLLVGLLEGVTAGGLLAASGWSAPWRHLSAAGPHPCRRCTLPGFGRA